MLSIEKRLYEEFELVCQVAGEIEFYIDPAPKRDSKKENNFLAKILKSLVDEGLQITSLSKEVAVGQFEISLAKKSPKEAIADIEKLKELISKTAAEEKCEAIFEAKPFADKPGCGLHIHVGLYNKNGSNALARFSENMESSIMVHAVGGLCASMLKDFTSFAPSEKSYQRFTTTKNPAKKKNPLEAYNNSPVNVSWGGNNRTTAIRIPSSTIDENERHIEHRVCGADVDPQIAVEKILQGIYLGLKDEILPPEKIYGNAFDGQYDFLEPFPETLEEAQEIKNKYSN